jgi:hypothetical protein
MLKSFSIGVIFCFLASSIIAQSNVKFYAQVDAYKVILGSYVEVEFILENGDGADFEPPQFNGFDVLSGPNQSTSMTIVNGRRSNKISLSYTLRPKKVGVQTIGSATVKLNTDVRSTQPIKIEVIKGSPVSGDDTPEIFINTVVSDSVAYVGQQLILDYKLYTLLDVRTINLLLEPEFDGFYKEVVRLVRQGFQREIYNGKEYYTKSAKRMILFPQQTGTYEIESVPIELGITKKGQQSRSFFFSQQLIKRQVLSTPLTIVVKNTPPTSRNFSGAVGQYSMTATTPKRSITTDDAIIVKMRVVGNGDSKTVSAPIWPASDSLEIYDPNIIEDETNNNSGQIRHAKTFEYLLVPKYTGRYNLNPQFTYYDPDSADYVTLTRTLPPIRVLKGSNKEIVIETEKVQEIEGIMTSTKLSSTSQSAVHGSWWHNLLIGLIALSSIGLVLYYNRKNNSPENDPEEIKRKKAYSVAVSRLDKAKTLMQGEDSKAFYEEITIATKKYISDKYKIPAMHINNNQVIDQLKNREISDQLLSNLGEIFKKSEMGLYAPSTSASKDEIYNATVEFISQLES